MRTVVREKAADDAIDACAIAFARGREVCEALIDLISRLPTLGQRIAGTNPPEFVIKSAEPLGAETPVVTMHYRMEGDGNTVTLIRARYHDA